jgi:hypothetical protein
VGKELLCPKSRTREAGGRVVEKLSKRLRRMRRRVLDGSSPEVKLCGPKFDQPGRAIGKLFAALDQYQGSGGNMNYVCVAATGRN